MEWRGDGVAQMLMSWAELAFHAHGHSRITQLWELLSASLVTAGGLEHVRGYHVPNEET